jgi:hypothetical protein
MDVVLNLIKLNNQIDKQETRKEGVNVYERFAVCNIVIT